MKKLLLSIIAICTTSIMVTPSFAYTLSKPEGKSGFVIGIFDITENNGVIEKVDLVQENIISRSNPSRNVCWILASTTLGDKVKVVEKFTSPKNGVFYSDDHKSVVSNKDKTQHIITSEVPSSPADVGVDGAKELQNCWFFEPGDPLGKYSLTVTIDGITYPSKEFTLIK